MVRSVPNQTFQLRSIEKISDDFRSTRRRLWVFWFHPALLITFFLLHLHSFSFTPFFSIIHRLWVFSGFCMHSERDAVRMEGLQHRLGENHGPMKATLVLQEVQRTETLCHFAWVSRKWIKVEPDQTQSLTQIKSSPTTADCH